MRSTLDWLQSNNISC